MKFYYENKWSSKLQILFALYCLFHFVIFDQFWFQIAGNLMWPVQLCQYDCSLKIFWRSVNSKIFNIHKIKFKKKVKKFSNPADPKLSTSKQILNNIICNNIICTRNCLCRAIKCKKGGCIFMERYE